MFTSLYIAQKQKKCTFSGLEFFDVENTTKSCSFQHYIKIGV